MQKIIILAVGGLKEKYWRDAINEYEKRLKTLCAFEICELPESKAEGAAACDDEGKRILQKIPTGFAVVPLCIEGKELSSNELSDFLQKSAVSGKSGVCFIIGGSWGLSDEVKSKADLKLSFSRMTFPHQLFRVMLTEQIYRAYMISANSKYHK